MSGVLEDDLLNICDHLKRNSLKIYWCENTVLRKYRNIKLYFISAFFSFPGFESRCWRDLPCRPERPRSPLSLLYNGYWIFTGIKWSQPGADHSPPSSASLRMGWSYISASPLLLHWQVMKRPKRFFHLHTFQ